MKPGDKILINKPNSMFDGLVGTIITNNPESNKQLKVDLDPNGIWQFFYHEVEVIGGVNKAKGAIKIDNTEAESFYTVQQSEPVFIKESLTSKEKTSLKKGIKEANAGDIEPIENLFKKRKYAKRGSAMKEDKPKRKYSKRIKI
jgi:hypothetical protein